ncbi:hypothetical protein BH20ACT9_BH20ACT9_20650 [soil metagenome]
MARTLQIRNVPEEVHRVLRTRAANAGLSLSDYLLVEVERVAQESANADILMRADARPGGVTDPDAIVEVVRELRASR